MTNLLKILIGYRIEDFWRLKTCSLSL